MTYYIPNPAIFYLCDCKKECNRSVGCIKNGGDCYRTKTNRHAKYGSVVHPEDAPGRFMAMKFNATETYFLELSPEGGANE